MSRKRFKHKVFFSGQKIFNNALTVVILSVVCLFFLVLFFMHDMPDLDRLETKGRRASIVLEASDGKPIATYGDLFGDVVRVDELPKYVRDALVAVEDRRFYRHFGIDVFGLIRAAYINAINRKIVQGGSTITQQLAKNLFLSPSKSVKRKVQEFVLAIWLERKFTKKQILSIYLNRVYFGACAYGIDAAAQRYFRKQAKKLSLYETAKLIGMLRAPSIYSPIRNPAKSDERAAVVLSCMVARNYITENEKNEALLEREKFSNILAQQADENKYFTDWALEHLHGCVGVDDEDLIIKTTMDSRLQKIAAHAIRENIDKYGFANGVSQGALVAIDQSGAVKAMIGGYAYDKSPYNRALALRSFGSVFKYFVYLTALEKGFDIYDRVSDKPISIGSWSPKNYAYTSVGSVSLMDAFVKSLNTCTIHISRKIGIKPIIKNAENFGITGEIKKDYSSMLGSSGTTLLEMTSAFSVTMRDGLKISPYGILSVKTRAGKVLYRAEKADEKRVVSSSVCKKMKMMMREIVNRGTGKRAKIPRDCYGKTGTSNDSRDACFVGISAPLTVGVWVGNDDNSPMHHRITGGTLPAMIWHDFMLLAFGYPTENQKAKGILTTNNIQKISDEKKSAQTIGKKNSNKRKKHKISDLILQNHTRFTT